MQTNLSPVSPGLSKLLSDYASWTESIWMGATDALTTRDYAVMGLGVPGECGEVAEVLVEGAGRYELMKELGDVVYYWARICAAFGFEPAELWERTPVAGLPACSDAALAAHLCIAAGKVAEALKKFIRDTANDEVLLAAQLEKLQRSLGHLAAVWQGIVAKHGMSVAEVLAANRSKVTDRHARGVMQGNGNDR